MRPGTPAERLLARAARVGADPADDEDTRSSKGLLVLISLLLLAISVVWASLYLAFGSPVGFAPLVYGAILAVAIALYSRTGDFPMLLRVNQLDILLAPTLSMIPLGGFIGAGGVGLWGVLAPLGALVFSDVRSAIRWFVAWLVIFLGSGTLGVILGPIPPPIPVWFTTTMLALNIAVGSTIVFTLLAVFATQRRAALTALRAEQARAEGLLLNILPSSIADRLKADSHTIADQFSSASILFADVVDFTPRAEAPRAGRGRRPPRPPVQPLRHAGRALRRREDQDDRRRLHGRVGRPRPRPDHARALVSMGLDMVEAMHSSDEVGHLGLELRIGINSGPVVAGVIGRKRFLYDLWGDAVNTASRMESHGTPGRVQITRATYELVADDFECEPRGTIAVKGKGEMEIWHVLRRRPDALPQKSPAPVREADAVAGG